ncbi:MAG TPA: hypothetical protein VMV10_09630 [Pirellulales bacterium]|nr:hypothetical protein [Pirellulales bacterium]
MDAEWVPLTALDWHSLFPADRHWRDAAILSLMRLAHKIASSLRHRCKDSAGGGDLFSAGIETIVENIDEDRHTDDWAILIRRRMIDWLRRENRGASNECRQRIADDYAARAESREPWQELIARDEVAEAWQSCLTTRRRQRIFELKDKGWTEEEIAAKLKIGRGAVQHTIDKVYVEACSKLGLVPTPRKARAPGRGKRR